MDRDECKEIVICEEWEAMSKAQNAMAYRNYIVNKSASIKKMTSRKQQFDSPTVISILSKRNASSAPKPRPNSTGKPTQTTILNRWNSSRSKPTNTTNESKIESPSSAIEIDDVSDFSSSSDDVILLDSSP